MIRKLNIALFIILLANFSISAKELVVNKNGKLKSITSAVKNASPGDVILVTSGVYKEGNIVIDKRLTLTGKGYPVIDGEGKGEILTINSDSVKVSGFVFNNAGVSFITENAAVKINNSAKCDVSDNKFNNNFFAVYLSKSENISIKRNIIISNAQKESNSGNGIHLWNCKNVEIENNQINGHRDGIYLEFVDGASIIKNKVTNALRYGLHFMFSDNCSYVKNIFEHNGAGAAVMYSKNVSMLSNRFFNNWGSASYGLLLKDISDSRIEGNQFNKNTTAVYIEGCNRVLISGNNLVRNGWGVKLMANSADNTFSLNNFVSNSFDISTNSRQNFNNFDSNYWSTYSGYDLNKDGIGDTPHHPVRFFSIVVEQQRASLVLLNSLFIKLLDTAESIIPSLTPEKLVDNNPLMKAVK